jgi:membrane associated rhomboid family serine protease
MPLYLAFTIGASGAVMGVLTVYCLLFPERRMMLYGFIDLTAAQLLQLMTGVNLVGAGFQRSLHIDFTGHLGGQIAGLALHEKDTSRFV